MGLKNRLLFFLAKLTKKHTNAPKDHFLLVSTTGLGDSIWATPAIRALRAHYPKGYIAILTSQTGKEIFETNPHLDEIFLIEHLWKVLFQLRKRTIHTVIIFHTSQRIILPFCRYIKAHRVIGSPGMYKGLDHLLDHILPDTQSHEIIRRLHLVHAVGAIPPEKPQLEIHITKKDSAPISHYPLENALCIHPGAQNKFKCWPLESFALVAKKMQANLRCSILLVGSPMEKNQLLTLKNLIGSGDCITDCSIRSYAALLKKVRLFLTNDTGPMHLAAAVHTQTIALFGPTNPLRCGPLHAPHVHVLATQPTCTPCLRKKCNEPFCLMQISPDTVYTLASTLWTQ